MFEWGYLPPRRDKRPNQHRLTPEQLAEGRAKGRKSSKGKLRGDRLYYQALVALRRNSKGQKKAWQKGGKMRQALHARKIARAIELRGDSKAYKRPPRVEKR